MHLPPGTRSTVARLAVLALACGSALVAAAGPAAAAVDATISGTVTTAASVAIPNASVSVRDDGSGDVVAWGFTNASGAYSIPVEAGTYLVEADTSGAGYTYAAEYYLDALDFEDATPVTVATGATATVNFQLDLAARLCVSVTDGFGNVPTGAAVSATRVDGRMRTGYIVQSNGMACFPGLPPGAWYVNTHGDAYVAEYYDDAPLIGDATPVTMAPGEYREIDVKLAWPSGIRGTVTGPSGQPVADTFVAAQAGDELAWAVTAADGTYELSVPAGTYVVSFEAPTPDLWIQWYDGALTPSEADPVTVVADEYTAAIDAQLTAPLTFSDVLPGSLFYDDIMWLVDWRITLGFPDGTFRRTAPVTREAMAAFLHRLDGGEPSTQPDPGEFTDVTAGNRFHDDIQWLAAEGITTGYPDGSFHPSAPVARQAMAAFLYRFAGEPAYTPPATSPFVDVRPGDPFYAEICWLAAEGVTTGTVTASGTYFKPTDAVARQAMAAFLHRLWTNVLNM